MTHEEINTTIDQIIIDHLGVDFEELKDEARLREDLGADSLDEVELVMQFEDDFDIEITDEEAAKIKTLGEAKEFVRERKS